MSESREKVKVLGKFLTILAVFEEIVLVGAEGKERKLRAKIDTGAYRTSIDLVVAQELGLLKKDNVIAVREVRNSMGVQKRDLVKVVFRLAGRTIATTATVADRSSLRFPVIIGRRDLEG